MTIELVESTRRQWEEAHEPRWIGYNPPVSMIELEKAMPERRIELYAIQTCLRPGTYQSPAAFAAHLSGICEAVNELRSRTRQGLPRSPALVVFPEDIGTFLLLAPHFKSIQGVSSFADALKILERRRLPEVLWLKARHKVSSAEALLLLYSRFSYETYFKTFSTLALRHRLVVVGGSIRVPDNRFGTTETFERMPKAPRIYNLSLTFNTRGEVIHVGRLAQAPGMDDPISGPLLSSHRPSIYEVGGIRVGSALDLPSNPPSILPREEKSTPPRENDTATKDKRIEPEIVACPHDPASILNGRAPAPIPNPAKVLPFNRRSKGLLKVLEANPNLRFGINPALSGDLFDLHFSGGSIIVGRSEGGAPIILEQSSAKTLEEGDRILKVEAALPAHAPSPP